MCPEVLRVPLAAILWLAVLSYLGYDKECTRSKHKCISDESLPRVLQNHDVPLWKRGCEEKEVRRGAAACRRSYLQQLVAVCIRPGLVRLSYSMYSPYRNPIHFIIYFANIFHFLWPGLLYILHTVPARGLFAQHGLQVERFGISMFLVLIDTSSSLLQQTKDILNWRTTYAGL